MVGGVHGRGACMVGHAWHRGMYDRGHAWQRGSCMAGGMQGKGGVHGRGTCMAGEMATAAEGTHPTGMHSYLLFMFFQ